MSARARLILAAVAVVLAAGCAHPVSQVPHAVQPLPFLPTLTASQTHGLTSVPWSPVGTVGPGDTLEVRVPAADCPELRGAVVNETPADVTLQVFATLTLCSGGRRGFLSAPVHLPSPLGNRPLRHGPVPVAVPPIGDGPPARHPL